MDEKVVRAKIKRVRAAVTRIQEIADELARNGKVTKITVRSPFELVDKVAVRYQVAAIILHEFNALEAEEIIALLIDLGTQQVLAELDQNLANMGVDRETVVEPVPTRALNWKQVARLHTHGNDLVH